MCTDLTQDARLPWALVPSSGGARRPPASLASVGSGSGDPTASTSPAQWELQKPRILRKDHASNPWSPSPLPTVSGRLFPTCHVLTCIFLDRFFLP